MNRTFTWTVAAMLLTAMCISFAALWYGYGLTAGALTARTSMGQELRQLTEQDSYTRSLSVVARDTKPQRDALAALAFHADLLDAIQVIESASAAAGAEVSVVSIGTGEQRVGSTLAEAPVTLELAGSFSRVTHALMLFESLPHLVSISQVRMGRLEQKDEWMATVQLEVGHRAPRKPEPVIDIQNIEVTD